MAGSPGAVAAVTVVLVFVVVLLGFAAWWLVQQRVMSKPWLEVGPDPVGGPEAAGLPTAKIALGVFLAVVGALFALFASAYFMRMEFPDWRPTPLPRILWVNTLLLALASVLLHCARAAEREGDRATVRLGLAAGGVATLGFLAGQLAAWRELAAGGLLLDDGPAISFFYLLTGLHGLHILGGLGALALVLPTAWDGAAARPRAVPGPGYAPGGGVGLSLELCATYWHFLLLVWVGLLALFTGWAAGVVALCRQILA
jgi:cytochrome c oxidase subunit 3